MVRRAGGKSEYARHLAKEMGLSVLQKRASELQSMFLGESEKNIACAFRQAREKKKFLIFDEADSFLQDRTNAVSNWEISHVNEMLTWMESHPLVIAEISIVR
ncbi:MAG: ATP-binding protein [Deltaproteobacteria bacterium]|jgi:SpoVK/Ycf46/Vps4 family AAA+-type ATPase|nr:ATP-binding protein [Deltaproteobacteria bacterium]